MHLMCMCGAGRCCPVKPDMTVRWQAEVLDAPRTHADANVTLKRAHRASWLRLLRAFLFWCLRGRFMAGSAIARRSYLLVELSGREVVENLCLGRQSRLAHGAAAGQEGGVVLRRQGRCEGPRGSARPWAMHAGSQACRSSSVLPFSRSLLRAPAQPAYWGAKWLQAWPRWSDAACLQLPPGLQRGLWGQQDRRVSNCDARKD